MHFHLPGSDTHHLLLSQLWEGDFTLKGVGTEAAQKLAREVALRHGGTLDTRHANWIIPCRRGLALFEELDKLRAPVRHENAGCENPNS
ncbi:hypothetical protein ACQUKI_20880 [Ralstonia pseudosolanacearum]